MDPQSNSDLYFVTWKPSNGHCIEVQPNSNTINTIGNIPKNDSASIGSNFCYKMEMLGMHVFWGDFYKYCAHPRIVQIKVQQSGIIKTMCNVNNKMNEYIPLYVAKRDNEMSRINIETILPVYITNHPFTIEIREENMLNILQCEKVVMWIKLNKYNKNNKDKEDAENKENEECVKIEKSEKSEKPIDNNNISVINFKNPPVTLPKEPKMISVPEIKIENATYSHIENLFDDENTGGFANNFSTSLGANIGCNLSDFRSTMY